MSGGGQQKVALARVLLKSCKIVLADEPTGNLDYNNSVIAFDLFEKIRKHGKTVVIVTHDFELGKRCDYIIDLPKSRSDVYDL